MPPTNERRMKMVPGEYDTDDEIFDAAPATPSAQYMELDMIGNGAYGTVYKARSVIDGSIVALKKIRVQLTEEGFPTSTLREIATLKQIDQFEHPNIIRLLDICHGEGLHDELSLYLVFEHVDQDLAQYMEMNKGPSGGISRQKIKNVMHQIFHGIDFLHSHRIMHRDLKPQNILINNDGIVKLADFGLAKTYFFYMRLTSIVVTLWYRSPEVLLTCPYAANVDVWSAGCIMSEMLLGSPLFAGKSEGDQLDRIFNIIGTPRYEEWPDEVSLPLSSFKVWEATPLNQVIPDICEDGADLLKKIFVFNPAKRISSSEILDHSYFDESNYIIRPRVDPRAIITRDSMHDRVMG